MVISALASTVRWLAEQRQNRVPVSGSNPFLEGPYAPVSVESSCDELRVEGEIPRELNGLLARIGPNPLTPPNPATYHWFVGDGMVHGLRLRDGKALWYRNRWVGSDKAQKHLGRPKLPGKHNGIVDTVNTNIIGHAGKLWALVEAGAAPIALDHDLNSLHHGLFNDPRRGGFSAHPHVDPHSGELHAICYDALVPHRIWYQVISPQGELTRRVPIPVRHGPMMHDCALTHGHVVILDLPITFSLGTAVRGAAFPYRWNPKHEARVGLLPRNGTARDIRWYALEPCYVFHTGNARELADGTVLLDAVVHERMFDGSIQGPEPGRITFERWTLPASGDTVQRQVLCDRPQEFPRFDERRAGDDYRYCYTLSADLNITDRAQPLIRHDLATGRSDSYLYGEKKVFGEAVFVPREKSGDETDGWLLSWVYDLDNDRSEVVILNAGDFGGAPQAVIPLPVRVPMCFHGNWIALDD